MAKSPLERALAKAGGQSPLARICGVSQPTVWGWLHKRGGVVPAEYVLLIERETGISRHDLRPDLYPREGLPPFQSDAAADGATTADRKAAA